MAGNSSVYKCALQILGSSWNGKPTRKGRTQVTVVCAIMANNVGGERCLQRVSEIRKAAEQSSFHPLTYR